MRFFFFGFAAFSMLFSSCTKKIAREEDSKHETLKSIVQEKSDGIFWTDSLEAGRLQEDISRLNGISKNIRLDPIVVSAARNLGGTVFPEISDFGSLNVSEIPASLLRTVESFSETILKRQLADKFISEGNLITLALLSEEMEKRKLSFTNYIIGESFVVDDVFEVPVRLYSSFSKLDLRLYFVQESNLWRIEQIQIK